MTKAHDARQDLVCSLRPSEGLRALVCRVDVATDGGFEFLGTTVNTAPQLLFGEGREPTLHEIHPRATGRGEVHVEARVPQQPAMNGRRLVGARVVDDEMDVERARHRGVDGREELPKFTRPVALMKLTDDRARLGIQGGEEGGRPV